MRTIWLTLLFLVLEKASGFAVNRIGSDLSGSLEGAGGLASQALLYRPPNVLFRFAKCSGGLLARSTGYGSGTVNHYYYADGIGNITAMVDRAQALSASYRYDTFGNLLSSSGSMAGVNMRRFSSKMQLSSSVLLYFYGFRFHDPNLQRWLNRDPIGERGGKNLYTFVKNSPFYYYDSYGWYGIGPGYGTLQKDVNGDPDILRAMPILIPQKKG